MRKFLIVLALLAGCKRTDKPAPALHEPNYRLPDAQWRQDMITVHKLPGGSCVAVLQFPNGGAALTEVHCPEAEAENGAP